jgi:hypothetical protein
MRWLGAIVAALALAAATPGAAAAAFGIEPGSAAVELLNAAGEPEHRAGAHPDRMVARFAFTTGPGGQIEENVRDVAVDLPLGMVGDPSAVPACPRSKFNLESSCPPGSQVGIAETTLSGFGTTQVPVYNLEPGGDSLATIGFTIFVLQSRFRVVLRSDDYGTRLEASGFVQDIPLLSSRIELWGVPADHLPGSELPRRPFLTNPTSCDPAARGPALRIRTWQQPARWLTTELPPLPLHGCESLPFAPSLEVSPASPAADSPTGLRIALDLPQSQDPDGLATAHVKSAEVTLPPGFSLSPGVASGLAACTDAELGAGEAGAASCPAASRIGSVELRSPAVAAPLRGPVYFGVPTAAEPFRVFIVAALPGGQVKVRALLRADPASGRLTALLTGLPQLPVSRLALSFDDGPRAAIASPPACSGGAASARIVPFGGAAVSATAPVTTTSGPAGAPCRRGPGFAPAFVAGASPPLAGRSSAFTLTVRREDGEAELGRLQAKLPPGLVARLAGVDLCSAGAAVAGSCPRSSRLGSTQIEAGAGPAPLAVSGDVYLTGPYGGAPFGLALALPVRVGPFDLGTTTIRAALLNDAESGRLTVATDPFPRLVAGISLRLRTITLAIDRPGFIQNPTSCAPAAVEAVLESVDGATAWPATPFQVRRCNRLRFAPRVAARLLDARTTRPGLELRVRPRRGDANLRSVVVELPDLVRLDADAAANSCTREQFRAGACPAASWIGSARATTPLLAGPLRGPVRLVKAGDVGPPQLWTSLRGQGLRLTTRSSTSLTVGGQIVNTIAGLPDLPLTSLTTRLRGGGRSFFTTARPPCRDAGADSMLAEATLRGQNGAELSRLVRVEASPTCGARNRSR